MKQQAIRKKLFTESAVSAGVLAVLGGIVFFLGTISDDYEAQRASLEGQVNALSGEMTTLKDKFTKVKDNSGLYDELLQKSANDQLSINRQAARAKFDDVQSKYFLNMKPISILPVTELAGSKRTTSNAIVTTEVTVSFDALNDEDAYNALFDIQDNFPGITRITKFSVVRGSKVTEEVLRTIASTGKASLVTASLQFTWFGMKPLDPSLTGTTTTPTGQRRRR